MKKNTFFVPVLLLTLFFISRSIVYFSDINYSDMSYYAYLGNSSASAKQQKMSLHDYLLDSKRNKTVFEYPPLSAFLVHIPNYFIDISAISYDEYRIQYKSYFRGMLWLLDSLIFIFIYLTVRKMYGPFSKKYILAMLFYIIAGHILYHLLYDRLDIVLGFILIICFYCQLQKQYFLSALLLSLGIFFKLIPILLIPIWCIGWLPYIKIKELKAIRPVILKPALRAVGFFIVISAGLTLFSLFKYGSNAFMFLDYHGNRGIQIESTYSSLIQLFSFIGLEYHIKTSFGSQNIIAPISSFLSVLSPVLIIIGISLVSIRTFFFSNSSDTVNTSEIIAVKNPIQLAIGYALSLIIILIFSKVLSTQFFIFLLPFIAISLPNRHLSFSVLFIYILLLTTLIFPFWYDSDIVPQTIQGYGKPSLLGTGLLVARNFLLILFFILLYQKENKPFISSSKSSRVLLLNGPKNFQIVITLLVVSSILMFLNIV